MQSQFYYVIRYNLAIHERCHFSKAFSVRIWPEFMRLFLNGENNFYGTSPIAAVMFPLVSRAMLKAEITKSILLSIFLTTLLISSCRFVLAIPEFGFAESIWE